QPRAARDRAVGDPGPAVGGARTVDLAAPAADPVAAGDGDARDLDHRAATGDLAVELVHRQGRAREPGGGARRRRPRAREPAALHGVVPRRALDRAGGHADHGPIPVGGQAPRLDGRRLARGGHGRARPRVDGDRDVGHHASRPADGRRSGGRGAAPVLREPFAVVVPVLRDRDRRVRAAGLPDRGTAAGPARTAAGATCNVNGAAPKGPPRRTAEPVSYSSIVALRLRSLYSSAEISPLSRSAASLAISSAAEYPSMRRWASCACSMICLSCSVIFGRAIT